MQKSSPNSTPSIETKGAVIRWLREVVVGLNLCPFARWPMESEAIRIAVCDASERAECQKVIVDELQVLLESDPKKIETTLVVFENGFPDFIEFWDFVEEMNDSLADNGLIEIFQLASFHPDYRFEGEGDDRSNYTNRSPYPILHLLRQESMTKAILAYGEEEVDEISSRNIKVLDSMSEAEFKDRFSYLE